MIVTLNTPQTVYRRHIHTHHIITDDVWIYAIYLNLEQAEHILSSVITSGADSAYIATPSCSCGSRDIHAHQNDECQFTHFYCRYCGNTIDDHLYDHKSFTALLHNGWHFF